MVEFVAIDDDLLRMHGFDGAERDGEVTGILDIDNNLGPSIRRDDAHSAELLASVGSKRLESNFDFFLHGSSPADQEMPVTDAGQVFNLPCEGRLKTCPTVRLALLGFERQLDGEGGTPAHQALHADAPLVLLDDLPANTQA